MNTAAGRAVFIFSPTDMVNKILYTVCVTLTHNYSIAFAKTKTLRQNNHELHYEERQGDLWHIYRKRVHKNTYVLHGTRSEKRGTRSKRLRARMDAKWNALWHFLERQGTQLERERTG